MWITESLLFPVVSYDLCLQPLSSISCISSAWKRWTYMPKLWAWYLPQPSWTVTPPTNCRYCSTWKLLFNVSTLWQYLKENALLKLGFPKTLLFQQLFVTALPSRWLPLKTIKFGKSFLRYTNNDILLIDCNSQNFKVWKKLVLYNLLTP